MNEKAKLLFETIVSDVHSASIQIATLAIILGECARPDSKSTIAPCRHAMHDDSTVMLLALCYGEEVGFDGKTIGKLTNLYGELAKAKRALTSALANAGKSQSDRARLADHARAWRRIANEAAEALRLLDEPSRARLNPVYLNDAVVVSQFLKRAADGDLADVTNSGVIDPPKLKQRRRSPRVPAPHACQVILPSGSHPARILDVSREGLGIQCATALGDRQKVIVELEDGRRLEAAVIRQHGGDIGLKLRTPLSLTDPLFGA